LADYAELEFTYHVNRQLEGAVTFGPEVEDRGLIGRIGMRPMPFPLDQMGDLQDTGNLGAALNNERFRMWVIPHSFSVRRERGLREPTHVSLQVRYKTEEGQTFSIQGLMPQPQYLQVGSLDFSCALTASGALIPDSPFSEGARVIANGLSAKLTAGADAKIGFSAKVTVPVVSAIGIGDDQCAWAFEELGRTVLGRDTQCWSLVVLPRIQDVLSFEMRLRITHRVAFFASRMDTDWVALNVELSGS
jgi:hypothetical protein